MKKTPTYILLLVIILLSVSQSTKAQSSIIQDIDTAYLSKLIATAKANYPRVKNLQNHIEIAQQNIGKARASYFDAFTFSYVYQPHSATIVNTAGGTTTGQNYSYFNGIQAGVFFNLGNFLQKPYAVRVAKQELLVANSERDEYFLTLTTEVKKRYYTYILRLNELKIQSQSAQDADQIVKTLRHKFEKGEDTYENYNKAQVTFADRNQTRIAAEANLLNARADLEELLGQTLESVK
ncbi:TolC family protein [Mucilaginibacter agri]|uniref:TolC family protein n=1 Tax=Mucilaginibacter agri TaxID=2695265 RepID=A0A965ZLR0_9SPHI|nr:TolC family protein [Mucilaginibacter agri]NCD72254.1 TolC family protein [Mucilaginibacter agri]